MSITLRLLGGTELTGTDGESLAPLLAQPKRFALLVQLVLSQPSRMHRRDALLAMFWPELDDERARGALSQALSFLRRTLGDGVVLTRGVEEIGIDVDRLDCDVLRFERAVDAGEHERAVTLYRGHLLDAFHVDECPGFADWLDGERRRLRERAARSARAMAAAADRGSDVSVSVLSARRALMLAPYDEAALCRLMIAMELAGRRGHAIEEYTAFVARLDADLGVEPSTELRALADAIRSGSRIVGLRLPQAATVASAATASDATAAADPPEQSPAAVKGPASEGTRPVQPSGLGRAYAIHAAVLIIVAAASLAATRAFGLPPWVVATTVLGVALLLPLLLFDRRGPADRQP